MKHKAPSRAEAPVGPPLEGEPSSPIRILVVDGDSDLRLLYSEVLVRPAYQVDAAKDGKAGWEALQANDYHLLITEHDIPKLTGVELVKKIRTARMALPVVLAAGRLPTHELARDPSLRVTATLLKPFAIEALLKVVKKVLRATGSTHRQLELSSNWRKRPSEVSLSL